MTMKALSLANPASAVPDVVFPQVRKQRQHKMVSRLFGRPLAVFSSLLFVLLGHTAWVWPGFHVPLQLGLEFDSLGSEAALRSTLRKDLSRVLTSR